MSKGKNFSCNNLGQRKASDFYKRVRENPIPLPSGACGLPWGGSLERKSVREYKNTSPTACGGEVHILNGTYVPIETKYTFNR